jgi:hypothetical protein
MCWELFVVRDERQVLLQFIEDERGTQRADDPRLYHDSTFIIPQKVAFM